MLIAGKSNNVPLLIILTCYRLYLFTIKSFKVMPLIINAPPADKCCQRCKKHIDDLLPFTQPEFNGAKLVKTFRSMIETVIDKYDLIVSEYKYNEVDKTDNISELEAKYGKKEVDNAFLYDQLSSTVEASWECKDCIIN